MLFNLILLPLLFIDAPEAPGRPKVDDIEAESVSLSWTKPIKDGGGKVLGYVVEAKEKGSNVWKPLNEKHPCKDTNFVGEYKNALYSNGSCNFIFI